LDAIYVLEGYNKLEEVNIKRDVFYIESKKQIVIICDRKKTLEEKVIR